VLIVARQRGGARRNATKAATAESSWLPAWGPRQVEVPEAESGV
jgi:hypothetical protein